MTATANSAGSTESAEEPAGDQPGEAAAAGPATTARRQTRRGRDTQARLIVAAHELFDTTPFNETRVVDITKRAGIAAGSFYTYFTSKEELFRVVAGEVLEEMYAAPRRDPDNTDRNPVRDIAYASRSYFEVCRKHRIIAQSIELLRTADRDVGDSRRGALKRGVDRTARWIKRLQDQGICDPNVDPWYTGLALQAMNVSLAYDQLVHRGYGDGHDIDELVAAVTPIWARAVGLDGWL